MTELRTQFDEITPAQREVLERGFDDMRARFDEMERDGSKAELAEALKAQRAQQVRVYLTRVQEWERDYPKDPRSLVALRLRRFLDLTQDLDFTAQLVEHDRKMRFSDATLENR